MRRAALILGAIATLVLLGYPSAPLLADSSTQLNAAKGPAAGAVTTKDTGPQTDGPSGGSNGGGTNGDADGLSGARVGAPRGGSLQAGDPSAATRIAIFVETWWKFMIRIR